MGRSHVTKIHRKYVAVELTAAYELHPQVSLRPERFGALAYHFGNRKLSFVKHPDLLRVLEQLDQQESLDDVLDAVDIDATRRGSFVKALETLEASEMVRARV